MRNRSRLSHKLTAILTFLLLLMPGSAFGVTMTWERNWGTYDGTPPYADGSFLAPADVAADKWGNVYVTGGFFGDDRVQMFNASGTFVKKYDNSGTGVGQLSRPRSITTDRWGAIYVSQQGNARIEVFHPQLYSHARTISSAPSPADVTGIAVGLDGLIINSRSWNDVQRRDRFGTILAPLVPHRPVGVAVSHDGEIYVASDYADDPLNPQGNTVFGYGADGGLRTIWGGTGTAPGRFQRPYDVGVDPHGDVFVVEYGGIRGQVMLGSSTGGAALTTFGDSGPDTQRFASPWGVGVGFDRTVYVADTFNHRISKWKVSTPTRTISVAGADRYLTAIEASTRAYPDGADAVVLATGANWPDALGGAALAGVVNGPLLLTRKDSLPGEVAAEITRLGATTVYVLGSTDAVSAKVFNDANALTSSAAIRLGGANRYETANKVAERVVYLKNLAGGYDGTAFVCTGTNFPDALAVSPIAAANGWPIYLTAPSTLTPVTRTAMLANGSNHGYIIGSTDALSAGVGSALEDMSPLPPGAFQRLGGKNRYETAATVAEAGFEGMGMLWSRPALAIGENFPDALAGGVLQGSDRSVMLLTRGTSLSGEAAGLLSTRKDAIYEIRYLGGTNVLSNTVRTSAKALLW